MAILSPVDGPAFPKMAMMKVRLPQRRQQAPRGV
jgi:hypothetical protein